MNGGENPKNIPQRLKPRKLAHCAARLKPCPFKTPIVKHALITGHDPRTTVHRSPITATPSNCFSAATYSASAARPASEIL